MVVDRRVIREGVVAGLIGAAAVAVWFLVVDAVQGAPLRTPAILGAVILHGARDPYAVSVTAGPILGYTVLHGLAFIAIGLVAALLVAGAEREPAMLLALLIVFAAFEVFFLALIAFLAQPVLGVVVWWEILIGNLLASAAMFWYYLTRHQALGQTLLGRWLEVIREGLLAGLIGAAAVAVWFFVYDTLKFRPLRTPALLGAALFLGDPNLADPKRLDIVLAYTVLHVLAFAVFGIAAAALLYWAEREPRLLLVLLVLFLCFELFFLGFVSALDEALLRKLPWENVAIGNLLAAVSMLVYFFLGHRGIGARLFERWTED